jgi:hypothetical protein
MSRRARNERRVTGFFDRALPYGERRAATAATTAAVEGRWRSVARHATKSARLKRPSLVVTMGALVFAWLAAYAHLAARMSRRLARPRSSALLNGAVGTVLVALGARLGLGHA